MLDRQAERAAIDRVLRSVRDGFSATLVIWGYPGIGKTALLGYAADSAADTLVCGVTGIGTEIGLEFAALHQLLIPFLPGIGQVPGPQRLALRVAFGMAEGPPADLLLAGLAALTLLGRSAEEQPVLCLIDDGQWLDAESALALASVARRLYADRVGMVIAVSEPAPAHAFERLPALWIGGLPTPRPASCCGRSPWLGWMTGWLIASWPIPSGTRWPWRRSARSSTPMSWPAGQPFPSLCRWAAGSASALVCDHPEPLNLLPAPAHQHPAIKPSSTFAGGQGVQGPSPGADSAGSHDAP